MEIQPILFDRQANWTLPRLSELPPDWSKFSRIGLDTETCDPDLRKLGPGVRHNGFIAGISFAIGERAWYLPVRHGIGENLDPDAVFGYLRDQAKVFTGEIVGANLSYDLDYLAQYGVIFRKAVCRDIQVAAALINELEMRYSLQAVAERAGFEGKDETILNQAMKDYHFEGKGSIWKLPARLVAPYAEMDALLPVRLLGVQEKEIEEQGLREVFDLESALLPVLVKMRRRGVRIDFDRVGEIEQRMLNVEQVQAAYVRDLTGQYISPDDINKAAMVAKLLKSQGVDVPKTDTGKPNVDRAVLEAVNTPASLALLKMKRANKIRTTFVASIRRHAVNGRIHCTFNQLRREREGGDMIGAAFGRISSSLPNLQQQPVRDDLAEDWRTIYLPDGDGEWACLDYSQQEPRLLLHWASSATQQMLMPTSKTRMAVERAVDLYQNDPKTDSHTMMAELTGLPRKQAKVLFLGLCYGMGGVKLAESLGLETGTHTLASGKIIRSAGEDALDILDKFNEKVPHVKWMAKHTALDIKKKGYLRTLSGRRCRFPQDELGNYEWTHKSLNRLIQGSAADQTKRAMVEADAAGYRLQLQVHDELDLTVKSRTEAEGLAEIMRECTPLDVPSVVDIEIGPTWGEIE
jgi:DNA polymerase I-like protein with 3'-5' exonuclease and polymerase domains